MGAVSESRSRQSSLQTVEGGLGCALVSNFRVKLEL